MTTVLMLALASWATWLVIRRLTRPSSVIITDLEAQYWRAREVGDIAAADQIEAALRDTPGSGWESRQG